MLLQNDAWRAVFMKQKMDMNQDGVISLEEFMETCIKVYIRE